MKRALLALVFGWSASPALAMDRMVQNPDPQPIITASATLKDAKGADLGKAELSDGTRGVMVRLNLRGLTPGWHAVHFHEKGDCSDAKFKAAGGHVHGVTPATHGLLNSLANDSGDLPNIYVTREGTAQAELVSTWVTLRGDHAVSLLDSDGAAIVIHAMPDDHMSQPIDGAGDRVACGVIK